MRLQYTKDKNNQEILCDETGKYQVMMEWEKPYMEKCIELLEPSGCVLEIGFGLGYSARKICENINVTSYSVIECSPVVWNKIEAFINDFNILRPELKINIIKGRWEDVLETLDIFDCVFFDDYTYENSLQSLQRANKFLFNVLKYHTKICSKICSYSTSNNTNLFEKITFVKCKCIEYEIPIPDNCNYAKGNKMYIPLIEKINEYNETIELLQANKILEKKIQEKTQQINNFYKLKNTIQCNLLVIDNFYSNPMETRNYILTQEFKIRGNYPGQRTISYASEEIKNYIEKYISGFAGKIIDWNMEKTENNYNGSYQYTTSRDRSWIHTDPNNKWAGVLYLTPNAPLSSGTGIYMFQDGTRYEDETSEEVRNNKKQTDMYSQDMTKWKLVDKIGNVFNRLILFNSKQFHMSMDYFGTSKENGRLFQVFFFTPLEI
jgi:hypothetical protein